jgi:serine/threonine protein kinase/tetratricopeptide (TPR) repeat protein
MTPARLQTIEETFHAALECSPDRLSAFLDTRCAGDRALRTKVEALLASHREETSVDVSISAVAASVIGNGERDSIIGETIGHYRILERIGAGGMGEVYLASDINVGRAAALKLLPASLGGDSGRLKRFEQEARAVAGLNHPNIMTIYEVGADDSRRYIASELIEGETLRQRLGRGCINVDEAVEIAVQVASALAAAHSAGVVHRDIKPENIMLRPDGYVKVLDFGIAKLAEQQLPTIIPKGEALTLVQTNVGSILGTVSYMSPEQARGAPVDKCTDIWSLGVVIYEMIIGHAPFTGDTPREIMSSIVDKEPLPLLRDRNRVPELQQIVTKALRKNPDERFQSARDLLAALKHLRHKLESATELEQSAARDSWLRWMRSPVGAAAAVLSLALAGAIGFYSVQNSPTTPMSDKSVAVLPFENLSDDKANSYFADGMQDEILNDLAKVADLKVVSRTSVMQYKTGIPRNLREIGSQLGVGHVVEGSVERSGTHVRISAQLIDARSDHHVWNQTYDRELSDIFAVQSEIAKTIADQLRAKLSPDEKKAIDRPPTSDISAFDLYTRAKNIQLGTTIRSTEKTDLLNTVDLLNQATARDAAFFDAYCQLAYSHDMLYFTGYDHTPARVALAEAAVHTAFRLRPEAGEAHLARARNLYYGYLEYDGALAELEAARQSLPNNARLFEFTGYILRRQGRWDESTGNLERAIDLDPRNVFMLQQVALSYDYLRRYADEKLVLDRVLTIVPNDTETQAARAWMEFNWRADSKPLHQLIDSLQATNPALLPTIGDAWLISALANRNADAAMNALQAFGENKPHLSTDNVPLTRLFVEGLIARTMKDDAKAQSAFTAARTEQEKTVQAQPNYGPAVCLLGLIDAGLGRKEEALKEGRRAVELLPVEKDSLNGAALIKYLATIAAWVDDKDLACEELATAIRHPGCLNYGHLKLLPFWDPLRGDPRFEKIVASLAPKQ